MLKVSLKCLCFLLTLLILSSLTFFLIHIALKIDKTTSYENITLIYGLIIFILAIFIWGLINLDKILDFIFKSYITELKKQLIKKKLN